LQISNRYGLSRTGMIVGQGAESIVDLVILLSLGMVSLALLRIDLGAPRLFWFLAAIVLVGFVALTIASRFLPRQLSAAPGPAWLPERVRTTLAALWPSIPTAWSARSLAARRYGGAQHPAGS
jgi:hypothetical protein